MHHARITALENVAGGGGEGLSLRPSLSTSFVPVLLIIRSTGDGAGPFYPVLCRLSADDEEVELKIRATCLSVLPFLIRWISISNAL